MGAIVIPHWFILVCIAAGGMFESGRAVGKDQGKYDHSTVVTFLFGPACFLFSFGLILIVIVAMV